MDNKQNFIDKLTSDYTFKGGFITMGGAMLGGECLINNTVKIPLKT